MQHSIPAPACLQAMQGGKPHFQRHDKEEHQHGDDEVRPFRPEDFIDSCSVGGSMTLYRCVEARNTVRNHAFRRFKYRPQIDRGRYI